MVWLGLVKVLLGLAKALIGYLDKKQLIDAGMAKGVLASMEATNVIIDDALAAARAVRADPDSQYARELRAKYSLGGSGKGDGQ